MVRCRNYKTHRRLLVADHPASLVCLILAGLTRGGGGGGGDGKFCKFVVWFSSPHCPCPPIGPLPCIR